MDQARSSPSSEERMRRLYRRPHSFVGSSDANTAIRSCGTKISLSGRKPAAQTPAATGESAPTAPCGAPMTKRPMLSEKRRETLQSMYSLVGSHSAVKLCRWQKSMMRGRGGCYKWTFYGIRSHRCMEATPSMACANKCTFCWRLNTNPTATEWKWDIDDPLDVVEGMLTAHKALVKNAQGIPGVTKEKFKEAMEPRHCALSLVGEPIIYPRVNEFLKELHSRHVSTFMVNNGQFPDAITALDPVTQLYLSVDGPSEAIMKRLDRPVFKDFWQRFNDSVKITSTKSGRKVFRLTMIEGINMGDEHVELYKELFANGNPHFIEFKALNGQKTFLRITNVPTWERLLEFAQKLCDAVGDGNTYAVACVHEHSKCILLGQKKRFYNADTKVWNTWIDFDKFHEIINTPYDGPGGHHGRPLAPEDYLLPTPDWATYGVSETEGFDPTQERRITPKRRAHLLREAEEAAAAAGTADVGEVDPGAAEDEEEETAESSAASATA